MVRFMQSNKSRSKIIADFLLLLEQDKIKSGWAQDQLVKCDKATQDLLHELELGEYKDRGRVATKLSQVRKDRRFYKDLVEEAEITANWLENNKKQVENLKFALGKMRKVEGYHKDRKYYPRIITEEE